MSDQRMQAVREQVKSQWVKQPNGTYSKPVLPAPDQNAAPEVKAAYLASGKGAQPKKRIRQDSRPLMNKLESEWYEQIRHLFPNYPRPRIQAKRYRLGNGIWYKPDFTCSAWHCSDGPSKETAWEVKGPHAFRGGFENLKVAAAQWPEVRFILAWKDEAGQWQQQEILP